MSSAKQESATYSMLALLREWDQGTKDRRHRLLEDFIASHKNRSGPEIELEMAQMASLFLARVAVWMKLTYMTGLCLTEQLQCVYIYLSASSSHNFLQEFLEHGGVLCLLEIICLKQAKEVDKEWALKILLCIANSGVKYKEVICESYGIRAVAECMAKSKSETTQESARSLLERLADGNPRFVNQVYKGLIGVLPCTSPKAQQMALQTLRIVQPIVKTANRAIVERVLALLQTLHLEVQSAALELIRDLMTYEVQEDLLRGLVQLLRPQKELRPPGAYTTDADKDNKKAPMPVYVAQSAAAKCIKSLAQDNLELSEKLIQLRVVHKLLFAMGNSDYPDSQRQGAMTLEYFCRTFPIVDEHVREAMGQSFYDEFMANPEALYVNMSPVNADVLVSNKVNIPGDASMYLINVVNQQE